MELELHGIDENMNAFSRMMTDDPELSGYFRKLIRTTLKEARKKLSNDAKRCLSEDPRKAARAVKFSVYKTIFGGNISILQKRFAGARFDLVRHRLVDENPTMRGGNRWPRYKERNRLDYYYGADRGFILRFISSGTVQRQTRYGNRGSIAPSNWFGHTAPWHLDTAATQVADAINEYVKQAGNGEK